MVTERSRVASAAGLNQPSRPGVFYRMLCPAPVRPSLRARLLVPGALAAFAGAVVLLAVLHLDRRLAPLDPVSTMLSDYALSPGRWMWDGALLLTSSGSALLLVALYRRGLLANPALVAAKALWCLSLLAVAVFAKDPQGGAITATGKIHLYASAVTCLSLPVVGWALGRRHRPPGCGGALGPPPPRPPAWAALRPLVAPAGAGGDPVLPAVHRAVRGQ